MTDHPIALDHRQIAKALLASGADLQRKEGQFLGGIAFDGRPLTDRQRKWLAALIQRHHVGDPSANMPDMNGAGVHGILDKMRAMAEADPADGLWVSALMKLAQLTAELQPRLRDDQMGVLIAVGALIMPLATAECQAGVETGKLLQRLKGGVRD